MFRILFGTAGRLGRPETLGVTEKRCGTGEVVNVLLTYVILFDPLNPGFRVV